MTFKLQINTSNAAFSEWQSEVARILREVADTLDRDDGRSDKWVQTLRDINGNNVGHAFHADSGWSIVGRGMLVPAHKANEGR